MNLGMIENLKNFSLILTLQNLIVQRALVLLETKIKVSDTFDYFIFLKITFDHFLAISVHADLSIGDITLKINVRQRPRPKSRITNLRQTPIDSIFRTVCDTNHPHSNLEISKIKLNDHALK